MALDKNDLSLERLTKLGAEIFYEVAPNNRDIAITGAAVIADLIELIPDYQRIKNCSIEMFKEIINEKDISMLPVFETMRRAGSKNVWLGNSIYKKRIPKVEFKTGDYSIFEFEDVESD